MAETLGQFLFPHPGYAPAKDVSTIRLFRSELRRLCRQTRWTTTLGYTQLPEAHLLSALPLSRSFHHCTNRPQHDLHQRVTLQPILERINQTEQLAVFGAACRAAPP